MSRSASRFALPAQARRLADENAKVRESSAITLSRWPAAGRLHLAWPDQRAPHPSARKSGRSQPTDAAQCAPPSVLFLKSVS